MSTYTVNLYSVSLASIKSIKDKISKVDEFYRVRKYMLTFLNQCTFFYYTHLGFVSLSENCEFVSLTV